MEGTASPWQRRREGQAVGQCVSFRSSWARLAKPRGSVSPSWRPVNPPPALCGSLNVLTKSNS